MPPLGCGPARVRGRRPRRARTDTLGGPMHPPCRSRIGLPGVVAVAVVAAVLGCSHGGGGPPEFGILERVEVAPLPLPDGLPDPSPVQLTNAFPALVFDHPVFLCAPPDGTNRVVVVEQPGRIHV